MIETERFYDSGEYNTGLPVQTHDEKKGIPSTEFPLIAKTLAELEEVLAEELITLGANNVELGTRMVSFTGDKAMMYKTNVHCRAALRILKPIHNFKAESADEVYEAVKHFNWEDYLSTDNTFSIDAVVYSHIFTHSKFVSYRVKDAIADRFTEKYGKRPSVSVSNPDIVLHIHVAHNKCTLSLDSSGESLHKRGYRVGQGEAPLNEVLAAGMILKSGWRGESDFIDPMCGSGTLLIEAGMIALGIPPGIHRTHFAFEKWSDFDKELFSAIYNDDSGAREFSHRIMGSDISAGMIAIAGKNIKNAGLGKYIDLQVKPFGQFTEAPANGGILMMNPPYVERMKVEDSDALYSMIGERLKHVFPGFRAYILSYRKESFDAIGLKHSKRFFLYNGALECEMREYEIFSGKRSEHPDTESRRGGNTPARDETHSERNSKEGYRRSKRREESTGDNSFVRREYSSGDRPLKRKEGSNGEKHFKRRGEATGEKPFKRRDNSTREPFKKRDNSTGDRPPKRGEYSRGERPPKRREESTGEKPREALRHKKNSQDMLHQRKSSSNSPFFNGKKMRPRKAK